jgi:hypothetical protein
VDALTDEDALVCPAPPAEALLEAEVLDEELVVDAPVVEAAVVEVALVVAALPPAPSLGGDVAADEQATMAKAMAKDEKTME